MGRNARSDGDCFDKSGPAHFRSKANDDSSQIIRIDWKNKEHCRCIAACLVKATYIIQKEIRGCGSLELAPAWWESFHFSLLDELKLGREDIFGAIFKNESPGSHPSVPHYVVAFRGTKLTKGRDLCDDLMIIANTLTDTKRFLRAQEAVAKLAGTDESCVIWLTGHSLGASLALDLGRAMMLKREINLPTILFNPPLVSLEQTINMSPLPEKAKKKLLAASGMAKDYVASFGKKNLQHPKEPFERLSPWVPELYVHEGDPICKGFINYFQQRQQVEEGRLAVVATQSFRGLVFSVLGKEKEQPYCLPSLTLSRTKSEPLLRAHKIKQWWKSDSELELITKRYPSADHAATLSFA